MAICKSPADSYYIKNYRKILNGRSSAP